MCTAREEGFDEGFDRAMELCLQDRNEVVNDCIAAIVRLARQHINNEPKWDAIMLAVDELETNEILNKKQFRQRLYKEAA